MIVCHVSCEVCGFFFSFFGGNILGVHSRKILILCGSSVYVFDEVCPVLLSISFSSQLIVCWKAFVLQ